MSYVIATPQRRQTAAQRSQAAREKRVQKARYQAPTQTVQVPMIVDVPRPMSGATQQAVRTGGWADPARGGEIKFIDVVGSPR